MNKKLLINTVFAAVLATTAATAAPIVVNGVILSDVYIDQTIKQAATQQGQPISPQGKKAIINQLVTSELLRQEAVRKKLDKSADYQAQLHNVQSMLLIQRLIEDFKRSNPVTAAEIKEEYNKLKIESSKKKKYHAQHILVDTEKEAQDILILLNKGKSFADLAKEKSKDPGSKDKGGDLGWFEPQTMVKEFSEAVTHLEKGQITQKPVKTQYGWHIILRVNSEEPPQKPLGSLEALTPELTENLMSQRFHKLIDKLRANATITGAAENPNAAPPAPVTNR